MVHSAPKPPWSGKAWVVPASLACLGGSGRLLCQQLACLGRGMPVPMTKSVIRGIPKQTPLRGSGSQQPVPPPVGAGQHACSAYSWTLNPKPYSWTLNAAGPVQGVAGSRGAWDGEPRGGGGGGGGRLKRRSRADQESMRAVSQFHS